MELPRKVEGGAIDPSFAAKSERGPPHRATVATRQEASFQQCSHLSKGATFTQANAPAQPSQFHGPMDDD